MSSPNDRDSSESPYTHILRQLELLHDHIQEASRDSRQEFQAVRNEQREARKEAKEDLQKLGDDLRALVQERYTESAEEVDAIRTEQTAQGKKVAKLEVKSGVWGGLGGLVTATASALGLIIASDGDPKKGVRLLSEATRHLASPPAQGQTARKPVRATPIRAPNGEVEYWILPEPQPAKRVVKFPDPPFPDDNSEPSRDRSPDAHPAMPPRETKDADENVD